MIPHPADNNIYCDGVDDNEDWDSLIYGKFRDNHEIKNMMIFETHNDDDDLQLPTNILAEESNQINERIRRRMEVDRYSFLSSGGLW